MIEARPRRAAHWLFRPYVLWLMRRHLRRIALREPVPEMPRELPWLWIANHNTWWDGFLVYLLNVRLFGRPLYLLMLEEQLRRFWFFRYLGAYGVRPGDPVEARRLLRYTAELLQMEPPSVVVWFPQGELLPYGSPIQFARGLELLLRHAEAPLWVQTVGVYPLLWEHVRPELYVGFGCGWRLGPGLAGPTLEELSAALEEELQKLGVAVRQRSPFRVLLEGVRSPHEAR
ncbi:MAG: lysophospholipid acyltransferase family protein [Chlorobiota bacterium]